MSFIEVPEYVKEIVRKGPEKTEDLLKYANADIGRTLYNIRSRVQSVDPCFQPTYSKLFGLRYFPDSSETR